MRCCLGIQVAMLSHLDRTRALKLYQVHCRQYCLNSVPSQWYWVGKCWQSSNFIPSVVDSKEKMEPCWPFIMKASAHTEFVSLIRSGDRLSNSTRNEVCLIAWMFVIQCLSVMEVCQIDYAIDVLQEFIKSIWKKHVCHECPKVD
jgi:hypothetical protein